MRDVKGFVGRYAVDFEGKVYSFTSQRFIKPFTDSDGYKVVKLSMNGKKTNKRVHRLVAEAYIPNPRCCDIVNHIDGRKWYNCAQNLEWVTSSENNKHAYKTGLKQPSSVFGEGHGNSKLSNEDVLVIYDLSHNSDLTQKQIGDKFNVSYAAVSDIKRGKKWSHITKHINAK